MQSYGSFGYLKDDGIVPSSNYERYSARFKGFCTNKKMDEIWLLTSVIHICNSASLTEKYGQFIQLYRGMAPIYPVYVRNADGNILTGFKWESI